MNKIPKKKKQKTEIIDQLQTIQNKFPADLNIQLANIPRLTAHLTGIQIQRKRQMRIYRHRNRFNQAA